MAQSINDKEYSKFTESDSDVSIRLVSVSESSTEGFSKVLTRNDKEYFKFILTENGDIAIRVVLV